VLLAEVVAGGHRFVSLFHRGLLKYESDQDVKRRAELLAMRTIFLEWWIAEWVARGGRF